MEYLNHEDIAYCTVFNLKLSQDELEVFESCMKHILDKCSEEEIYGITGCTLEELSNWQQNLLELILEHVSDENLPEKYRTLKQK